MHTFYKEHTGSYAVAVPWPTDNMKQGSSEHGWHVLFKGLSLYYAMYVVRYLNGGYMHLPVSGLDPEFIRILEECAA